MPGIAEGADLALVGLLQDRDDVRILVHMLDVGRAADRPEAAREGEMLFGRQLLVMQEDNEIVQRPLDLRERRVRQRLGEVDATDVGAERRPPSGGLR
jgi:hypothetical protein